jgi:L-ascorbate metabolism protein UlaG (beta-lactamase superfamily)
MIRLTIGLGAALLTAPGVQQRPALEARFIGNMAFAISDGAVTLMSDFPYQSGYSVYMTYPADAIRSATPATLSLITHRHGDHWEPALFMKTDWMVAGPPDVTGAMAPERVLPLAKTATFRGIDIEAIATPHAGIGHYSYVVTWHGRQLYFSGDTEDAEHLLRLTALDVAFVSPWLFESLQRRGRIDAKRIVIYHHQANETVPQCRDGCEVPRQGATLRIP